MEAPSTLPTVTLEEGAMYWVKPRYGTHSDRWTVAKWEVGSFWGVGGNSEISPAIISGPIPRPAESSVEVAVAQQRAPAAPATADPILPHPSEGEGE